MRTPFKIGITLFLWLSASLLALVFIVVSINSVRSMGEIASKVVEVKDDSLAETIENQHCLINIESLRRLAEIAYISDNQQTRRVARIDAQALADDSAFFRDKSFHDKAQQLSQMIGKLVEHKDAAHRNGLKLQEISQEFSLSLHKMAAYIPNIAAMQEAFQAFLGSSIPKAGPVGVSTHTLLDVKKVQADDARRVSLIRQHCESFALFYSALGSVCTAQGDLYADYAYEQDALAENLMRAHAQWEELDDALREMRDGISSDAEFATTDGLSVIEATAVAAKSGSLYTFGGGFLFFGLYLFVLHWFIVRPIRWTGKKFLDIQKGVPHGSMPLIHIRELYNVGDLLDRFSVYLTELTSRATQLAEDVADKRDLEELMTAVFQVSLDGYCVWSPDRVYAASSGFLQTFGVDDLDTLWANWEAMGFTPKEHLWDVYEMVISTGFFRREMYLKRLDGDALPCEVTYLPVPRRGEICILSYFRDLREQKRTEEELRQARDTAEAAAKVKSDFLARMSHEIRTPMNGVLGLTHLALANNPPAEQQVYLEKIQSSARILLGVINDILDFSKMESGSLALEYTRFSIKGMLVTISDLFTAQAEQKGLVFAVVLAPDVPEFIKGDELRLSQVLLNLCGNAIKFTEKGGVTLRIALAKADGAEVALDFSVTDSGLGMTHEQLSRLFQPFAQSDTSMTRRYGGTGLGLVISKLLVEKMRGGIEVQSEPGVGSTFSFTAYFGAANAQEALEQPTPCEEGKDVSLAGLRILLAEDNEINREIAVTLLESLGMTVLVASNGREAVALLEREDVDGVLMDIQMPEMDGLMAARIIREQGRASIRDVPIIAMTAHAMQEDRDKSMAAGMNGHLTKPIDVVQLRRTLCVLVAKHEGCCDTRISSGKASGLL